MKTHKLRTAKGFSSQSLHCVSEPHALRYLQQKMSFWVAALSLFTFLMGNMVGQHGWYAFWASVRGAGDDSLITYSGTVAPLQEVVDYECWTRFGGDFKVHTFRQSPVECRVPAPSYSAHAHDAMISMEYMSSYDSGEEGTGLHSGVDYRVPIGTPVQAVMGARVLKVAQSSPGFGTFVVLRHPNVPDPENPGVVTTLYSTYAHLSTVYVTEGEVIGKGDMIGLSGNTGKTTGPHLHFQMDRSDAPYVPYAPSTVGDGYRYTVSPSVYVQANYKPVAATVVAQAEQSSSTSSVRSTVVASSSSSVSRTVSDIIANLAKRRQERIDERLIAQKNRQVVAINSPSLLPSAPPVVEAKPEPVSHGNENVLSVRFTHDGYFTGRGWEKVRIELQDSDGNAVTNPDLPSDLKLVAAYGSAEFRPTTLSTLDFVNGTAEIFVLPRGRRTVVIQALPFASVSDALRYQE